MQRFTLAVCAVLTIASMFGAAGAATAALTVTIVQPATNPSSAEVDETVAFEAVAFNDGQELEYANVQWLWDFGDAMQSTNNPTSHAYVAAGDYTVTVTATFNQAQASATTHVIVEDDEETPKITGFDSSLSIYVGFRGHWINYASGESEFAEIEAPVAVFQPGEQVADDFETWFSHQINAPHPPLGWSFFSADAGETMQMHVIVRDTQNRLGDVFVTNRDSGAQIGTLDANSAGSQIDGYLDISSAGDVFTLSVRDKAAGNVICLAATNSPKVEDAFVYPFYYPWDPNRGDGDCPVVVITGDAGDPESLAGKKTLPEAAGAGHGDACAGPRELANDSAKVLTRGPLYQLKDKIILREIGGPPAGLSDAALTEVQAKIDALRAPYTGGAHFLDDVTVPPYSKGTGHWPVCVSGQVVALVCVPVGGMTKWQDGLYSKVELGFEHDDGADTNESSWKLAVGWENKQVDGDKWPVGNPIAVGDQYALVADNERAPDLDPLEAITTSVTFTLKADKTCPQPPGVPDTPDLIGGEATITRVSKLTTADPPDVGWPGTLVFPAQGEDKGTCIKEMPKGWKYRVTFKDDGLYACDPIEFDVPDTTELEIEVKLQMLQFLYVVTERDGQGVHAEVELKDPNQDLRYVGDSEPFDDGYRYWQGGIVPDGIWSVRARDKDGGQFSEWQNFQVVYSYIPKVVTVQVPAP